MEWFVAYCYGVVKVCMKGSVNSNFSLILGAILVGYIFVLLLSSVLFNSWWYRFLFVYSISILFYTIQRRIVVLYLNNTSIQQYLL